ncbi:hypothetical protein MANES_13G070200v8 [Manihot esculenta]|uniref:Uncharacterized protein n=1 Tax=Manihot esculenta TaxID=3983 RepID=A0A2C9UPL1_MANES|nr:hypothetical protein MANES_13G070200v8 [Manihot esculenta]
MKRRSPLSFSRTEPYLRFLKPGALAQLRDSRISARSHRVNSLRLIALHRVSRPSSPSSDSVQPQLNNFDGMPCFLSRFYGPRCPQRKKLVAAKSVLFLCSRPSSPVSDSPDPIINLLNSDSIVVAH